ncbi:hypothetical protein ACLNGM_14930 [Aureimonas phyllosphaerae]|uniref:hypothetical protein n=1 Tax=Aureimonas phyllosphaerae TaxID=1166078 RepID=UPI003A5BA795
MNRKMALAHGSVIEIRTPNLSRTPMLAKPLSHDEKVFKRAFKRACDMAGGTSEMARLLGMDRQAGQVSKWQSDTYPDVLPSRLFNVVDRIAGYPVMKEAMCGIDGFEIRAVTPEDPDMPICSMISALAGESGRALQVMLEANADDMITPREAECIEGVGKRAIQFFQRIIDAAHARAAGGGQ